MRMLGGAQRHVAPNTLLNGMVYSGVFERFPQLTVLLAEVGTGWLPFMYQEIDDRISPTAELFLGKYRLPLKPSEYLARNVKATPLNGGNDQRWRASSPSWRRRCWCSRRISRTSRASRIRPAIRGRAGAQHLSERAAFAGGTMAEVFARMGQPLTL